eukprot:jgi/Psemu1/37404/gm1.37404_g
MARRRRQPKNKRQNPRAAEAALGDDSNADVDQQVAKKRRKGGDTDDNCQKKVVLLANHPDNADESTPTQTVTEIDSVKNKSAPSKKAGGGEIATTKSGPNGNSHQNLVGKKEKKNKKETQCSNANRIMFLEEQVRIHEATLEAWRQRKSELLAEQERTVAKKQRLLLKRDELIEKQKTLEDARTRQLSLQKELKESLAMSRERLRRLTVLETEAEPVEGQERKRRTDGGGKDGELCSGKLVEEGLGKKDVCEIRAPEREKSQLIQWMEDHFVEPESQPDCPLIFDPYQKLEDLRSYYAPLAYVRKRPRVLAFLPHLKASQVGNYLTLMLREGNALDRRNDLNESGSEQQHDRNPRQYLLENTCLDILLLVPKDWKGHHGVSFVKRANTDEEVLERERLPLPSLSSFLSRKVVVEKPPKQKPKTSKLSSYTMEANHRRSPYVTNSNDIQNEQEEEDFMILPPPTKSRDYYKDETTNETETETLDQYNDSVDFDTDENDSDDELEEELLSLGRPLRMTQSTDSGEIERFNGFFWWSEQFPFGDKDQSQITKNMTRGGVEKQELSIEETLQEVFGLVIHHECPNASKDRAMASTELNMPMAGNWLEVKLPLIQSHDDSIINERLRQMMYFGRIIDASRLALHGGLDCIAFTLFQELKKSVTTQDDSLGQLVTLMGDQMKFCRFKDGLLLRLSCFETAFASQVGLSIISWYLAARAETLQSPNGGIEGMTETSTSPDIVSAYRLCLKCCSKLRNPETPSISRLQLFDGDALKQHLYSDELRGSTTDLRVSRRSGGDFTKNFTTNTPIDELQNLHSLISWTHSNPTTQSSNVLDVSEQQLDERLNAMWLIVDTFLRDYRQRRCNGVDGCPKIQKLNWELQCLKVSIVTGRAIFDALASFASSVKASKEKKANSNVGRGRSRTSAINVASWAVLDGAVARILKDLRKHVADTLPLIDVILAPIYACSVASAVFLRNYSAAQKRLTDCLGENCRHGNKGNDPATNLMAYSELLWSQLVQLRMSLPNDSPSSVMNDNIQIVPGVKQALEICDKKTDEFAWEPSESVKQENKLFVTKLESIGIRLRHVVLFGDWMLSLLVARGKLPAISPCSEELQAPPSKGGSKNDPMRTFSWKNELSGFTGDHATEDRPRIVGDYRYPPPSPLPQIPLQLLHAGHSLETLAINQRFITRLPESFGMYFPNLRELDLSKNMLAELPESFRGMTQRMKHLEVFDVSHNRIELLPPDIFSHAATAGISSQPHTLKSLNLSENYLIALPSMANLDNLEVLNLACNSLLDMTAADWSRLTLNFSHLRQLNHSNQQKKNSVRGREEN